MKLKDIKLKTCPFCDGEGVLIHSKPDDGYIYSEGVHAFVKCKECDACGPMPDVEYNHAASGYPGREKDEWVKNTAILVAAICPA